MIVLLQACTSPSTSVDTAPDSGEVAPSASFESAAVCGECHSRQYGEWQQSMHAYAALSPVFDAMAGKANALLGLIRRNFSYLDQETLVRLRRLLITTHG